MDYGLIVPPDLASVWVGLLMVLFKAGWCAEDLQFAVDPLLNALATPLIQASIGFAVHLVPALPTPRPDRTGRWPCRRPEGSGRSSTHVQSDDRRIAVLTHDLPLDEDHHHRWRPGMTAKTAETHISWRWLGRPRCRARGTGGGA